MFPVALLVILAIDEKEAQDNISVFSIVMNIFAVLLVVAVTLLSLFTPMYSITKSLLGLGELFGENLSTLIEEIPANYIGIATDVGYFSLLDEIINSLSSGRTDVYFYWGCGYLAVIILGLIGGLMAMLNK